MISDIKQITSRTNLIEEYPIFRSNTSQIWKGLRCVFSKGWSPKNILDIGAYDGSFALFCKKTWPDCNVYSVEPNPAAQDAYGINVSGSTGCYLIKGALNYFDQKKFLNFRDEFSYDSDLSFYPIENALENVFYDGRNYTLSDLFKIMNYKVDIIKINCCGGELDLISRPDQMALLSTAKYICGVTWSTASTLGLHWGKPARGRKKESPFIESMLTYTPHNIKTFVKPSLDNVFFLAQV